MTLDVFEKAPDVVERSGPAFRHHAPAKPWEAWRHWGIATGPGRTEFLGLRPGIRWLLLALGGWASVTFILAAVTILWPSPPSMPEPVAVRGKSDGPDYAAITERPLFAKTRHPATLAIFVPPAPPPRDHAIGLKGVFLNGTEARAFLTSGAEPQGRWLAMNDMIAGWTLASLTPDEICLKADGEMLTVSLHSASQSVGALPPRPLMPIVPRPAPSPSFPPGSTNASMIEPGQPTAVQEPRSGAPLGLVGMGAKVP